MKVGVQIYRSVQESAAITIDVYARDVREAYDIARDEDWHDYIEQYVTDEVALDDWVRDPEITGREEEDWEIEGIDF